MTNSEGCKVTPQTLKAVVQSAVKRHQLCSASNGCHVEHV